MICPQCQASLLIPTECANCQWKMGNNDAGSESKPPISPRVDDKAKTTDSVDERVPFPIEENIPPEHSVENSQVGKVEDVSNSPVSIGKDNITGTGHTVLRTQIEKVIIESEKKFKEEKSSPSWTIDSLPSLEGTRPQFNPKDLEKYGAAFKNLHLLIISCFDEETAKYAADAIIYQIEEIKSENSRTVIFEGNIDGSNENIHALLKQDEIKNSFILIDCINDKRTTSFIDSIFNQKNLTVRQNITTRLKDSHSFWICLVEPTSIDRYLNDVTPIHFPVWSIDFLSFLLEMRYPDNYLGLQERIDKQRKLGKWEQDQSKFFVEVRNFLSDWSHLIQELDQRDLTGEIEKVDVHNQYDWSDPIVKTLLFAATYLPNLTRGDMNYVMVKICGKKTISIAKTIQASQDENPVTIMQEKGIAEIWSDAPDKYIKECNLKMSSTGVTAKVFTFTSPSTKEKLKLYFEDELSFDLADKVESVWIEGLLFERSEAIVENVINLTIASLKDYADDYKGEWFIKHFLNNLVSKENKTLVYTRFSELLRRLLEFPQLRSLVGEILELLMRNRQHITAWEIVKRLQFAPNFNFFHWTKQLIERGGEAGEIVFMHLYGLFKRQDENIYELLDNLKSWLPDKERLPATYSPANRVALSIMIHYCLQSFEEFDEEDYGLQPSRYPLFAFDNLTNAEKNLSTLTEWLFHPGMRSELREQIPSLNLEEFWGILIVGWLFILLESNNQQPTVQNHEERNAPNNSVSSDGLLVILLEQISLLTRPEQQKAMLKQWENLKNIIIDALDFIKLNSKQKPSLTLQRSLLRKLIEEFKAACKRAKSASENI